MTTRAQVNGYLFLIKRLEHALIRRDVRMLHDPMSTQFRSLVAGTVLGMLALGACAVLGLLRPQGSVENAHIILGKGSDGLYVIQNGKLDPVLNLASARLIAGAPETPDSVAESKLTAYPRGPLLGIPGAPTALPGSAVDGSQWTLCQAMTPISGASTLVFAGRPDLTDGARALGHDEALLVSNQGKTYLLFDGKRAELDPENDAVSRALQLQGASVRPIGTALLDATVPVPAIAPPVIPHAGQPGPVRNTRIGQVIQVSDVGTGELYVVLPNGVQRISPLAAEVIRNSDSLGVSQIVTLPPDLLAGIPVLHTLPTDGFPARRPTILPTDPSPVACSSWSRADDNHDAALTLMVGRSWPLPSTANPVQMADGNGSPDRVDAVYLPPFSGEFVRITGIASDSVRKDGLCYISDTGIRYGITDPATAAILGMPKTPKPAPWEIIGRLAGGPMLSKDAAAVAHDTLPTGP
ncbi:type VII secretion protein EccB [Nocardia albiluteola]|uniref:type VII secretion protein EccB n=1 Tax=Nocardia albiluteola TaxID=2842303 RepID=UPI001FD92107|nr:type VII secretion protein EccB [Nocardia albiluteola]